MSIICYIKRCIVLAIYDKIRKLKYIYNCESFITSFRGCYNTLTGTVHRNSSLVDCYIRVFRLEMQQYFDISPHRDTSGSDTVLIHI